LVDPPIPVDRRQHVTVNKINYGDIWQEFIEKVFEHRFNIDEYEAGM